MSDSIPKPRSTEAAGDRPRRRWKPGWWTASLGFHGVLLVYLIWFSPTRVIERSPGTHGAPAKVGAAKARRVIEKIREEQAVPLAESVRTLQDIHRQLVELEAAKKSEFQSLARELGGDAPGKAAEALARVAEAQAKAEASLAGVHQFFEPWLRTRVGSAFNEMVDAQEAARESQTAALQMQEKAESMLSLGDARFAAALDTQAKATRLQDQARKAVVAAEEARDAARGSHPLTPLEREIEHNSYWIRRHRRSFEEAPQKLQEAADKIAEAEAAIAPARLGLEQAQARAAAAPGDESAQALQAATEAGKKAEKDLRAANRKYGSTARSLEKATLEMPELQAKLDALMAQLDPTLPDLNDLEKDFLQRQDEALRAQEAARQAQDAARAEFEVALARPAEGRSLAAATATLPSPPSGKEPTGMALPELYRTALDTEAGLTESYRQIRATELAMIRQIPLGRAVELTDVTKAIRPDLAGALGKAVASGEEAASARESIQSARAEINAMVQLGSSLLAHAKGLDRGDGSTLSMDNYRAMMEQAQRMEAMATEMEGQSFADVSGEMEAGGAGGWGEGAGLGGDGSGGPAGGWPGGGTGFGGQGPGGGSGGPGGGSGGGPGGSGGGPGSNAWFGGGGGGSGTATGSGNVFGLPGRRVLARGPSPAWVYIDSWYIIGPFDNTRRANVDRKFPPETTVDLNATYPGKNNVPVRWEFQQAGQVNVMPRFSSYNARVRLPELDDQSNYQNNLQYVIYYAYSELWFERECELMIAVGSDDYSKLWINDQLVWVSGKRLKPWKIDEGYRKVRFRQGVNRVLYRVENGNNRTEFSLALILG